MAAILFRRDELKGIPADVPFENRVFTLYAAMIYKHIADLHPKMWKTTHFAIRSDVEGSAAWSSKYGLGPGEDMPVFRADLSAREKLSGHQ